MLWLISGLIMVMGAMGGVEQSPDLLTYDGVWLGAFTLIGIGMMMMGASYVNDRTDEILGRRP
jgi:putative Mn2+ efflux pump MntP